MIIHEGERIQTILSPMKGVEKHMTTFERSTLIGVFADHDQANRAIDELRHAGISYDQIRLVERGSGSFVENIKSLFTGQTTTTTNSADDWMRIGVPEQDANNYQNELDAGRSIVLVKATGNPEQTLSILRQSGAYDIAVRLRTAVPSMAQGAYATPGVRQGAYNPNATPGTSNPNVPPATYNPNAQPGTYNPNMPPGTYDRTQPQPPQPNTRDEQNA
jgi:hypothetical protein